MSPAEALGLLGAFVGAVLGLAALLGLGVRLVLLPWLHAHLIEPIKTTLDDVAAKWSLATYMYEQHITRSSEEWGRLWAAIDKKEDKR